MARARATRPPGPLDGQALALDDAVTSALDLPPARRRTGRGRRLALAALVALAPTGAGCTGLGPPTDEERQVARNRAILDRLPTWPGAEVVREGASQISPEGGAEARQPPGFTTTALYRLSRPAGGRQVADFYERRLEPAWRCSREQLALIGPDARPAGYRRNGPVLLTCTRGAATVFVDTSGLFFRPPGFEVGVQSNTPPSERPQHR